MTPHGLIHWTELLTHNPEAARDFYGKSLGWSFDAMPGAEAPYWICMSGDEMVGGMFALEGPQYEGVPEHWMTYIAVDDVDARVAEAEKAGGKVVRPPWDSPVGRVALVQAPGGAVTGWMTPNG